MWRSARGLLSRGYVEAVYAIERVCFNSAVRVSAACQVCSAGVNCGQPWRPDCSVEGAVEEDRRDQGAVDGAGVARNHADFLIAETAIQPFGDAILARIEDE